MNFTQLICTRTVNFTQLTKPNSLVTAVQAEEDGARMQEFAASHLSFLTTRLLAGGHRALAAALEVLQLDHFGIVRES